MTKADNLYTRTRALEDPYVSEGIIKVAEETEEFLPKELYQRLMALVLEASDRVSPFGKYEGPFDVYHRETGEFVGRFETLEEMGEAATEAFDIDWEDEDPDWTEWCGMLLGGNSFTDGEFDLGPPTDEEGAGFGPWK